MENGPFETSAFEIEQKLISSHFEEHFLKMHQTLLVKISTFNPLPELQPP